jgi:hypothetical protein
MPTENDSPGGPVAIPPVGVFRHLSQEQRRTLSINLERHAEHLLKASHRGDLGIPKEYVTDLVTYLASRQEKEQGDDSGIEFRGFAQLASYCKKAIYSAVMEAIDETAELEELKVDSIDTHTAYSHNPDYADSVELPKDPETLLIEQQSQLEVAERERRIKEMIDDIRANCTPEQLARLDKILEASRQTDIYHIYRDGKRKGQLDLSPSKIASATGIPIDTVNKNKRAVKVIAARTGLRSPFEPDSEMQ